MTPGVTGVTFHIDQGIATLLVGVLVALVNVFIARKLQQVHTLVNSSFTEQKEARQAAEMALKASNDLNTQLRQQLDRMQPLTAASPIKVELVNVPTAVAPAVPAAVPVVLP